MKHPNNTPQALKAPEEQPGDLEDLMARADEGYYDEVAFGHDTWSICPMCEFVVVPTMTRPHGLITPNYTIHPDACGTPCMSHTPEPDD